MSLAIILIARSCKSANLEQKDRLNYRFKSNGKPIPVNRLISFRNKAGDGLVTAFNALPSDGANLMPTGKPRCYL